PGGLGGGDEDFVGTTPRQAQLTVRQPLYRGDHTVAGTERAENEVFAERARLADTEQDILLQAATAFMDVWRDEAVLGLNINNEQVLERQLEASRDRFQVGEITRTDVAQSESRLSGATAQRVAAEGRLRASRATYREVVGTAPGTLRPPGPLRGLPGDSAETVAVALAQNPTILAAEFSRLAAERAVRQNIGSLLPELGLVGELSHGDERSEEHTSELQSRENLVCRLLLEKKQNQKT